MKINQLIKKGLLLGAILSLTACGQGMIGAGSGGSQQDLSSNIDDIQIDKVEAETNAAEQALIEAQEVIDNLVKNGGIQLSGSSLSAQSLTGLPEKLEDALNKLYDKITLPVQKAKEVINKARVQIVTALAKLDPNNPLHQTMIAKLQEMMKKLDDVEGRLGSVYKLLATKVDILIAKVDQLIDRLDNGNPLLLIPLMEMEEMRAVIVAFRDKLAAT